MSQAQNCCDECRSVRKVKEGIVVSRKMDKTAVVRVELKMRHPKYNKVIRRAKKFYVHDEENILGEGDRVSIMETRPISKLKRWRLVERLAQAVKTEKVS